MVPKKRMSTKQIPEEHNSSPDYTNMIKDLANAATKKSPHKDKLDMWGEVVVSDIRELPIEIHTQY